MTRDQYLQALKHKNVTKSARRAKDIGHRGRGQKNEYAMIKNPSNSGANMTRTASRR